MLDNLRQKLLISLGLGIVVMLALSIYGDLPAMARVFGTFRWQYLPAILALTFGNYGLRFVKWQYYLGLIGASRIRRRTSLMVFFSGLSMVVTPGKVGEWLKSFLLKEANGTPISASAPIVIAERLTDGMAMLLLATVGLVVYAYAWQALLIIFLASVAVLIVVQWRGLALRLLSLGERLPLLSRRAGSLHRFYESSYRLLSARSLLLAVGIGLVSWFGECLAFFLVLVGLGLQPSYELLVQATFILAASTVIASVAFVPGGLAVAEGSIAGMLLLLAVAREPAVAAAATLIIRLCTLWFGVAVGVAALFAFSREMKSLALLQGDGHSIPLSETKNHEAG
ncbi:MAG: lysylphosphatidylglycerol synthase transmembrane domain-containing protein [Chloroflexota bacterium]